MREMMRTWWFAVLFACIHTGSCLKCLRCDEISHPRFCQVTTECGVGEVCFVESIQTLDGARAYRIGCSYGDVKKVCQNGTSHMCTECCNTDLCNVGLCSEKGYPDARGPVCYSCASRLQSETCNTISVCDLDEMCFVTQKAVFGDILYDRGCAHRHLCSSDPHTNYPANIIERREIAASPEDSISRCHRCCDTDLCNSFCEETGAASSTKAIETITENTSRVTKTTAMPTTTTESTKANDNITEPTAKTKATTVSKTTTTMVSTTTLPATSIKENSNMTIAITNPTAKTITTLTTIAPTTSSTTASTNAITPVVTNIAMRDCYDILKANLSVGDGLYTIYVNDNGTHVPVNVFCLMSKDGGGWTVFQYRIQTTGDFNRSFAEYEAGFGQWPGEFWLGLKWLHLITLQKSYALKMDTESRETNNRTQWRYSTFQIGPPTDYRLNVSGYSFRESQTVCTFENGDLCGYTQSIGDDFDWTRGSGWISGVTGSRPSSDFTYGTASGHYMYINAQSALTGQKARLIGTPNPSTAASCLKFHYHMYGATMGTLNVYAQTENAIGNAILTIIGNHSNQWIQADVTVRSPSSWRVVFEAVIGSGQASDIAIDDVSVSTGVCPGALGDCDFEKDTCLWRNANSGDDFDWSRQKGSTSSPGTGPSSDHTSGAGVYVYIETSGPRHPGDKAWLVSPEFNQSTDPYCMSFWYHMYGSSMGSLNVYLNSDTAPSQKMWTQSGNHPNTWLRGQITIPPQADPYQIYFEAICGNYYRGDIAIDDIYIASSLCEYQPHSASQLGMAPPTITPTSFVDPLAYHNGHAFFAFDRDTSDSCAKMYAGGWWYDAGSCYGYNLNGDANHFTETQHFLHSSSMAIRPTAGSL